MKHRLRTLVRVSSIMLALVTFPWTARAAGPKFEVIYRFKGGTDGFSPSAALISDTLGNIYGTTAFGGTGAACKDQNNPGCGTVFSLRPPTLSGGAWTETVLYRFRGGSDGAVPQSPLISDANGNLYGTTTEGGTVGCLAFNGTAVGCDIVFELIHPRKSGGAWTERVLYRFKGVPSGRGTEMARNQTGLSSIGRATYMAVQYGAGLVRPPKEA